MIGALLINLIVVFLSAMISLLPNATLLPESFNDAWSWMSGIIANIFWTIPSGITLLTILNFVIIIEGSIFTWKGLNWVINKIRGSGN